MKSNIVIPSWELVNNANVIKKFNFLPSLLSTIYLSAIVFYQVAFSYVYIFQKKDEVFSLIIDFVHQSYFIEVIIWVVIWLLLYLLIQPIAEAGILYIIDAFSKKEENKQKMSYWISQGLLNFLPLFEYHNFMWLFRFLSIVTFYFLLLRVFGQAYAWPISILMFVYLLFAVWINLLFAYTKFFILFEKKHVFEAISESTKMTLNSMDVTWKLYYTLFLVYARVIITIIVFTVFPLIISALFAYITTKIFFIVWAAIIWIIFIAFLLFISHLNSVLEIFVEALWYNAYMENKKDMPQEKEE